MSDQKPKGSSIAADASLLMLAKAAAFAVVFALPLIMVRSLSQTDFGLYRQFFLVVNTCFTLLPFGFVMSAFYFLPRCGNRGGAVALNIVLIYAIIGVVAGGILILDPSVLGRLFGDPSLAVYSRLLGCVVFVAVASTYVDLLALANADIRGASVYLVGTNVAKTMLLGGAALFFGSVRAILVASMIHGFLQLLFVFAYLKHAFGSIPTRIDGPLLRKQLGYSIPLGLAGWLYWLQTESHNYFVARSFGPATFAVYAIGCVTLPLTGVFGESIASVIIRRVSEFHSQNRRDEVINVVRKAIRDLAGFYLPLYAFLLVVGRDLLAVIYTPRFLASWPIFAINLILLPLAILGITTDAVIRSYYECRTFLVGLRVVLMSVMLPSLWYFTPRYGPVATVSIVVGINAIERLGLTARSAKALQLHWRDIVLFKSVVEIGANVLVAATAAAIVRAMLGDMKRAIALVITTAVFGVVYLGIMILRLRAKGERIEWRHAILPLPIRQAFTELLARIRRGSSADQARAKAA